MEFEPTFSPENKKEEENNEEEMNKVEKIRHLKRWLDF